MKLRAKKSYLCIADLHLGYEFGLRGSGFNIPDQTDTILKAITSIEEGDNLLLLGDIKHSIPSAGGIESYRVSRFLKLLGERFSSVTIVAGNHDGMIERSVPDSVSVIDSSGARISDVGFAHGHGWPSDDVMSARVLVWGHLHPCIRIIDRMGAATSIKCWLKGGVHSEAITERFKNIKVKESVVMPSFNHLLVGSPVNERKESNLSPLTRSGFIKLAEQRAITLEGVDLGPVSILSKKPGKLR
jgi:hypothetical protein